MAIEGWDGATSARPYAPEALTSFDALVPASRRAVEPRLRARIEGRVRELLGAPTIGTGPSASAPPGPDDDHDDESALAVAEQFVVDVASVSDEQRAALSERFGATAFSVVQVIWVVDFATRTEAAWRQLFGPAADGAGLQPADAGPELWPAMEAFMAAVARLDGLDPLTTELVRLRGARAHNCRLCRSLRHVRAVEGGADERTFDQVDDYERSDLSEPHRVALRLTDAMLWTPTAYPPGLVDQVRDALGPAEVTELVLDVTRNSANKIAVALGADEARVPEGSVELYDIGADGQLVYGPSPA